MPVRANRRYRGISSVVVVFFFLSLVVSLRFRTNTDEVSDDRGLIRRVREVKFRLLHLHLARRLLPPLFFHRPAEAVKTPLRFR